jgi:hypothetical protein
MGVALGWMALALALVGAPDAGRGGVPIKYTVRFLEVEGLGWRDAVFTRLTPVARQGAATVWTAPADVAKRMVACAAKSPAPHMIQSPAVTAWPGAPAHITTRANRQLVTQVSWNGDDGSVEAKPEPVRTGSAATMAGRKLDQGILVQMVLHDTQILAVHRVAVGGPKNASSDPAAKKAAYHAEACDDASTCCETGEKAKNTDSPKLSFKFIVGGYQGITLPAGRYMIDDVKYFPSGPDFPWADAQAAAERARMRARGIEPAPASKTTSGVVAAAAPAPECCSAAACCTAGPNGCSSPSVSVEVPEIGSQEIAGEWLIPNDGILLVSFGPHTVADKDGKAVIRERLAIVEADEAVNGPRMTLGPAMASPGVPILSPFGPLPLVESFPAGLPTPWPMIPAPAVPLPPVPEPPMPPVPSRSIPQGYHADGKAAELPPLPPDEADDNDADDSSESAEPRPSPQMKSPRHPGATSPAEPRPSADTAMRKTQFTIPNIPAIPSVFQAAPTVGLQFLLPIKPIWFKLPFNRRLEIEIYGRVVRAPEPARSSADLANKPAAAGTATK